MISEIKNLDEFNKICTTQKGLLLFIFYADKSENSKKAFAIFSEVASENREIAFFSINAGEVKDIHPAIGVNSVPTVITMNDGKVSKKLLGLQPKTAYEALLYESITVAADGTEVIAKNVILYTTPTCPHCTTVKNYLKSNKIRFREVNVASDQKAAEELMRKSGQTGVPQTEINGEIVVGADMLKLNQLLDIKPV